MMASEISFAPGCHTLSPCPEDGNTDFVSDLACVNACGRIANVIAQGQGARSCREEGILTLPLY